MGKAKAPVTKRRLANNIALTNNPLDDNQGTHATSYTDSPSLLPLFSSANGDLTSTEAAYTDIEPIPEGDKAVAQGGHGACQASQSGTMATNALYVYSSPSSADSSATDECDVYSDDNSDDDDEDKESVDNVDAEDELIDYEDDLIDDVDEEELILIVPIED